MSRPIQSGMSTQLNPFGPQWTGSQQAESAKSVGQQMKAALFGKPKPTVLDPSRFPHLAEQLKLLNKFKKKLATMAGDADDDYKILLADGEIASIDGEGNIYVGAQFLAAHGEDVALLIGVLAHEIGHRPKRWDEYRDRQPVTPEEVAELCRFEETRADIFAGKALAEMELPPEPVGEFLRRIEDGPHPEYFPAEVRAQVIADAHAGRAYRSDARRKMFPEFDRMKSPKGHLGEY